MEKPRRVHHLDIDRLLSDAEKLARGILDANGIIDEFHVIRQLLNLQTVDTYEATEDLNRIIVGKDISGLSAPA